MESDSTTGLSKTDVSEPGESGICGLSETNRSTEMVNGAAVRVIFSASEIQVRVDRIAKEIHRQEPQNLLVVCILKGGFVFSADLVRAMFHVGLAPEIEFLVLTSYGAGKKSSGKVTINRDIDSAVLDRDVVLIDDILESGRTLEFARSLLTDRGARRVMSCVLLNKQVNRASPIEADFYGFDCPDRFVIGYGMDIGHKYRQLPFIGEIRNSTDNSNESNVETEGPA